MIRRSYIRIATTRSSRVRERLQEDAEFQRGAGPSRNAPVARYPHGRSSVHFPGTRNRRLSAAGSTDWTESGFSGEPAPRGVFTSIRFLSNRLKWSGEILAEDRRTTNSGAARWRAAEIDQWGKVAADRGPRPQRTPVGPGPLPRRPRGHRCHRRTHRPAAGGRETRPRAPPKAGRPAGDICQAPRIGQAFELPWSPEKPAGRRRHYGSRRKEPRFSPQLIHSRCSAPCRKTVYFRSKRYNRAGGDLGIVYPAMCRACGGAAGGGRADAIGAGAAGAGTDARCARDTQAIGQVRLDGPGPPGDDDVRFRATSDGFQGGNPPSQTKIKPEVPQRLFQAFFVFGKEMHFWRAAGGPWREKGANPRTSRSSVASFPRKPACRSGSKLLPRRSRPEA